MIHLRKLSRTGISHNSILCNGVSLPGIVKEVREKREEVQQDLDHLPNPFSEEPQMKLLQLCGDFHVEIAERTAGHTKHPEFFKALYNEFRKLSQRIQKTKPIFEIAPSDHDDEDSCDCSLSSEPHYHHEVEVAGAQTFAGEYPSQSI